MTTETAPVAPEVAVVPVQEPSTTDVKAVEPEGTKDESPEDTKKRLEILDKKVARQKAANRDYERQLQAARDEIKKLNEASKNPPRDDKPNPDTFDNPDAYADALADWKIAQREKAKAEEAEKPDIDKLVGHEVNLKLQALEFTKKEDEFRKANADYDKNAATVNQYLGMANRQDPRFAAFSKTLLGAENTPAVVNYLGENPKEIMTLFNLQTPFEVQDYMEELIEKLSAPKAVDEGETDSVAITPKALPTPPSALKSGSAKVSKTVDQMSGRELLNKYMPKGR